MGWWESSSPLVEGQHDHDGYANGGNEGEGNERVNKDKIGAFGWGLIVVDRAWDLRATHT
jgi:hypothetical protein